MARTISQAQRVEGERRHGQVSPPAVIDRYYRLQPADLGGPEAPPRPALVRLVGVQGFEQPQPLLHLAGLTRPLLLDAANAAAMARIAASPLQRDWVGREVVLAVVSEAGAPVIRLLAPDDPEVALLRRRSQRAARARAAASSLRQALRFGLYVLVMLVLAAAVLFVVQNGAALLALATSLLEGLIDGA